MNALERYVAKTKLASALAEKLAYPVNPVNPAQPLKAVPKFRHDPSKPMAYLQKQQKILNAKFMVALRH